MALQLVLFFLFCFLPAYFMKARECMFPRMQISPQYALS